MEKFEGVSKEIGSAMNSVGEMMGIGRTVEESLQKVLCMVDPSIKGFSSRFKYETMEELKQELNVPTDRRIYAIAQALHEKTMTVDEIHDITKIDHWFLRRCENMVKTWDALGETDLKSLTDDQMLKAKKDGFSDIQISETLQGTVGENDIRNKRIAAGIVPVTKQIDTLAAEFPAETNYLYMTYHGTEKMLNRLMVVSWFWEVVPIALVSQLSLTSVVLERLFRGRWKRRCFTRCVFLALDTTKHNCVSYCII